MSETDEYTAALNRFCAGLSEKIAWLADEESDEATRPLVEALLDSIRETVANLLLCELECERILHRG